MKRGYLPSSYYRISCLVSCFWLGLVVLVSLGGCALNIAEEIAKPRPTWDYIPVTPEVWYGVSQVSLQVDQAVAMTPSPEFARQMNQALRGWNISKAFRERLTSELEGRVPFKLLDWKAALDKWDPLSPGAEAVNYMDIVGEKLITVGLKLGFEGQEPTFVLLAEWEVKSTDFVKNIPKFERLIRDFEPFGNIEKFKLPRALGGFHEAKSSAYSKSDWLAEDGKVIRSEMQRLVDELAKQSADSLVPKGDSARQ